MHLWRCQHASGQHYILPDLLPTVQRSDPTFCGRSLVDKHFATAPGPLDFLDLTPSDNDGAPAALNSPAALSELEQPPSAWLLAASHLRAARRSTALRAKWGAAPFLSLLRHEQPDVRWVGAQGVALHFQLVCCASAPPYPMPVSSPCPVHPQWTFNSLNSRLWSKTGIPVWDDRSPPFACAKRQTCRQRCRESCTNRVTVHALTLQSDAASDRLRQKVLTPEESLTAALRWRREDGAVAAEQAAMWLSDGGKHPERRSDEMDTDENCPSKLDTQDAHAGALVPIQHRMSSAA